MLVKNPYVKFILKGQGIFSLDVNKILRLQVTLNSRYAKNVITYSFFRIFAEGQESHVSQTNRVLLKRGLQPHRGSCCISNSSRGTILSPASSLGWLVGNQITEFRMIHTVSNYFNLPNHSKEHMTDCGLSLHQLKEARKAAKL